ncbi:MAG: chromophore lyase CpcT/CpeT [Aureispira sp.]
MNYCKRVQQSTAGLGIRFGFLGLLTLFCLSATNVDAQRNKPRKNRKYILPYLKDIKSAKEISEIYNKFDRFKYQIIGHFSNKEQVDAKKTTEPWQEFIVMPIFQDRPNEFWVYLEFFSPGLLDFPIDQRVEQYVQVSRDSFRMEVYYLKNPEKYINAWKFSEFPETDIREDLVRGDGCDLIIAHQDDKPGTYKTVTPEEFTCEMLTSQGAARYVDLSFELSDEQYLMWFHFYTRKGKHLKQSAKNGLEFKRIEKEDDMQHLLSKD